MGQPGLVKYGIEEERSDIRAHVSVIGKCVYVYPTRQGIDAIHKGNYKKRPAFTGTMVTAEGFLVPPEHIKHIRVVDIPDGIMAKANFQSTDNTSEKGNKAVRVVQWLLRMGLFPLMATPEVIEDTQMQVQGLDIIVKMNARIQVKCDWKAGTRPNCTGHLFLQVTEANPFKMH